MLKNIKIGKYKHYKGGEYEVIGLSHHSETLEPLVVYKALYESKEFGHNAIWVRPFDMFMDKVNLNGEEVPRFKYLEE